MTRPDHDRSETRDDLPESAVLRTLVENHREFLSFLERRVGDHDLAEDLLQDAFVRGIDKIGALRESDSVRAWFYRTLRNAIVDASRRDEVARRRLETLRRELDDAAATDAEIDRVICGCVARIAATLKPEYEEILRTVDVEGTPLVEFARATGISESNAGVRAFRARAALRREVERSCGTCAQHGCRDCSCGGGASSRERSPAN